MTSVPTTFKITFVKTEENRRFPASASFTELKESISSFWGEHPFVLTYRDEDDDVITVNSEVEFMEALNVAKDMNVKVLKFNAFSNEEELHAHLLLKSKKVSSETATPPHFGIECDKSGMNPILGIRYHIPGADYDLCSQEFDKLPESERALYVKISFPGAPPVPCVPGSTFTASACGGGPSRCPRRRGCPGRAMNTHNLPPHLSVEDMILQASIAASLFQSSAASQAQGGGGGHPFAQVLSSFVDAAGVAAVNAATSNKESASGGLSSASSSSQSHPLADLLQGIRNFAQEENNNCSGGGGGGAESGSDKCKKWRDMFKQEMREQAEKMAEQGGGDMTGHPLAHVLASLGQPQCGQPSPSCCRGVGGGGGASNSSVPVHFGIECDKSGMNPIVGIRYVIPGANYDLCSQEFEKLPESERVLYSTITSPGATPVPCFDATATPAATDEPIATKIDDVVVNNASATGAAAAAEEEPHEEPQSEEVAQIATRPAVITNVTPAPVAPVAAVVTPAVMAPKPVESDDAAFAAQLVELASMGFVDRDANLALLKRYQGRVDRVVNFILEL